MTIIYQLKTLFVLAFLALVCQSAHSGTRISFQVPSGISDLFMYSYYGDGVRLVDSLHVVDRLAHYHNDVTIPEGVYFIVDETKGERIDFLVGADSQFELKMTSFSVQGLSIEGAVESKAFLAYQQSMASGLVVDNISALKQSISQVEDGSFVSLVFRALLPPPTRNNSSSMLVVDQSSVFDYNISHYWDNYDLQDERLIRTPFVGFCVDNFLTKVLPPRTDLVLKYALPLLDSCEGNLPLLKMVASKALGLAIKNEIMGIDALGYEVIERYYLSGLFGDLPDKQMAMLEDYMLHTRSCRVGHLAKEMQLDALDPDLGLVSLYDTHSKFTLVLFWEPDCEHCKVLVPFIRDEVYPQFANLGLSVFAVNTQTDFQLWRNYILDHDLTEWTHAYDSRASSNFMVDYGVQGTPFVYILDADKRIVAKNVSVEYLQTMLQRLFATGQLY